ncbi:MAG: recombinase family protein [Lachnospiraceae bacterium]|nr:recombinase family protein [Lachnospiraceae bacterium]
MMTKQFLCAAYVRLSKEDGDKNESDSVSNQKKMIEYYIEHNENFVLYDFYIDDGFTGTNFKRPSFLKMLEEIEQGKVNCVIVKDLSRFGRDYIETGKYLERYFPERDIRFIAITDNIDSKKQAYDMLLPIKNIFNEQYARDISKKVNAAMHTKQVAGDFIGAFAKYGYKKSPENKNRLIIDEYAANVVRRIFDMYVNGMGQRKIAAVLNEENILCPSEYKRQSGYNYKNSNKLSSTIYWTYSTIHRIISDEMYIGNMVQGKTHRQMRMKIEKIDPDKWIKVESTHPAIIDMDTWIKAQKIIKIRTREIDLNNNISIFAGVLKCGDCGRAMVKKKSSWGKVTYCYYNCGTFNRSGAQFCTPHTIRHDVIEQIVLGDLHRIILNIENLKELISKIDIQKKEFHNIEFDIEHINEELNTLFRRKKSAYEDYQDGIITRDEYIAYKDAYEEQIEKQQKSLVAIKSRKGTKTKKDIFEYIWVRKLLDMRAVDKLDRSIVLDMISEIKVYNDKRIKIIYNFSDELDAVLNLNEVTPP